MEKAYRDVSDLYYVLFRAYSEIFGPFSHPRKEWGGVNPLEIIVFFQSHLPPFYNLLANNHLSLVVRRVRTMKWKSTLNNKWLISTFFSLSTFNLTQTMIFVVNGQLLSVRDYMRKIAVISLNHGNLHILYNLGRDYLRLLLNTEYWIDLLFYTLKTGDKTPRSVLVLFINSGSLISWQSKIRHF